MDQTINAYIDAHREEIIRQWKDLVNLQAESKEVEALDVVAQHLYRVFTEAGVTCQLRRAVPEAPQVLTGVIGADRPGQPIVFSGHYDTVFKKGTFDKDPFRIDDEGKAHGPGVLDMKGGVIMALYVIKALEASGWKEHPIRIVFCGDEENGAYHFDSAEIMRETAKGAKCAFNMETGPINNALCVGRKGVLIGSFVVTGVSAHSGNNFDAGRNAVVEAAHKMVAIDAMNDHDKGSNINVAVVHGGKMWNSIPDHCEVTFSGRFALGSEMTRVQNEVEALMKKTYVDGTTTVYTPGASCGVFEQNEANTKLWAFCSQVSEEMGLGKMDHVIMGGGSDAIQLASVGVPTLCSCGVCGEWNHTDREYALVESMFNRAKLWCTVVQKLDELSF